MPQSCSKKERKDSVLELLKESLVTCDLLSSENSSIYLCSVHFMVLVKLLDTIFSCRTKKQVLNFLMGGFLFLLARSIKNDI